MMRRTVAVLTVAAAQGAPTDDFEKLKAGVTASQVFKDKVTASCAKVQQENCADIASTKLFCALLKRSKPELAAAHCAAPAAAAAPTTAAPAVQSQPAAQEAAPAASAEPKLGTALAEVKARIEKSADFVAESEKMSTVLGCNGVKKSADCASYVQEVAFCLSFADQMTKFQKMQGVKEEADYCAHIDDKIPKLSLFLQNSFNKPKPQPVKFMQVSAHEQRAPEDDLAQEMTHDLEMNFNKIAPFGKEDTAKELQDHAAKTQDTLVDAVENAEVAEIKRAVFRALTRLRAATIKEFDTIARLETQAIDAYNDAHHYRAENPLTHLHEDEAPVETDKLKSFH
jgi:hypothetical protein